MYIIWFIPLIFLRKQSKIVLLTLKQWLFFAVTSQILTDPDLQFGKCSCRQKTCPLGLTREERKYRTQQNAQERACRQLPFGNAIALERLFLTFSHHGAQIRSSTWNALWESLQFLSNTMQLSASDGKLKQVMGLQIHILYPIFKDSIS